MAASKISIGEATVDHSPFLARVVLAALRSHLDRGPFDIAFPIDEREVLDILEWVVLSELISKCHFSKFLVAEVDGEPIGALAGFDQPNRACCCSARHSRTPSNTLVM